MSARILTTWGVLGHADSQVRPEKLSFNNLPQVMIVRPTIHPWVFKFIYWVKISTFKKEPRKWDGGEDTRAYHIQEESALVSETFVTS